MTAFIICFIVWIVGIFIGIRLGRTTKVKEETKIIQPLDKYEYSSGHIIVDQDGEIYECNSYRWYEVLRYHKKYEVVIKNGYIIGINKVVLEEKQ